MTQKTDPFISLAWGWSSGEDGWGTGLNNNLITYAFFLNTRFDGTISTTASLPTSPLDGQAYFVTTENTFYFRAEGAWYSTVPPVGKTFILKGTEAVYKFTGGSLVLDTKAISDVAGLQTVLDNKLDDSQRGTANGVAPLGADNKVPSTYLPESGSYKGTWNAATNTPTIVSGVGSNGDFYRVSVGGTTTINGESSWSIGDEIRFNGTVWQRIPNTGGVSSVNGETGSVILDANDVGATPNSHIGSGGSQHADATTTTSGFFTPSEKIKLSGISSGATANQTDSYLLSRANHTGTQAQSTITNLTTDLASKQATLVSGTNIKTINGASILGIGDIVISGGGGGTTFTALTDTPDSYVGNASKVTRVKLDESGLEFVSVGTAAFNNVGDFATASHTHADATSSLSGFFSAANFNKLAGIATNATANQTDSYLLSRSNHTGTQAQSTITNLVTDLGLKAPLVSPTFSGTVVLPPTTSIGIVSATEISYLDGVTSAVQSQIDGKQPLTTVLTNTTASFTTALESKLNEIAAGAEVNVNADWNATSGDARILNKPTTVEASGITNALTTNTSQTVSGTKTFNTDIFVNASVGLASIWLQQSGVSNGRIFAGSGPGTDILIESGRFVGINGTIGSYLSFNGALKLLTTSTGIDITGNISMSGNITGNGSGLTNLPSTSLVGTINAERLPYTFTVGAVANTVPIRDESGVMAAVRFDGSGAGLTNIPAANLTGIVANDRLNAASTSDAGIVQLSNSVSGVSTTLAATENAVTTAYNQATTATNTANTAISRLNSQYEAPEQQLNNLGTGSGTRTISTVNGTHVLATANGNCSWVFPSPSTDGARAITLELTNGGAFTMTWPAGTRWAGGVAPTLTASGTDILVFTKAGTANWRGYLSSKDNK